MRTMKETLSAAVENLNQTIDDEAVYDPPAWADHLEEALTIVEQALRRQEDSLESPEDGVFAVTGGQSPSPGMDRRVHGLHDHLDVLLIYAHALRKRVGQARKDTSLDCAEKEARDILRRRALSLLEALNSYEQEEAHLILENATTDIGTGD